MKIEEKIDKYIVNEDVFDVNKEIKYINHSFELIEKQMAGVYKSPQYKTLTRMIDETIKRARSIEDNLVEDNNGDIRDGKGNIVDDGKIEKFLDELDVKIDKLADEWSDSNNPFNKTLFYVP